jgi:peptidoglycan-associated lipoprotein
MSLITSSNALKFAAAFGAVAALSACASHPKPPEPAPVASTPSYTPPPPPTDNRPPPREVAVAPTGPTPGSTQDFVISAGDRVYFDYDQYAVRADGRTVLDKQAAWLQRYSQVAVRIEGNCDERGTREYNFALGARRADSIKAYLIDRGVSPARITTISYGKERPLDDGSSEDAMAKNRNGHTALTSGAGN